MKITFGSLSLAAGLEFGESPYELRIQGQCQVQIAERIRGEEVRAFDRGNLQTQLSFRVKRRHDSAEAAQAYALSHAAALARQSGPLRLINEPGGTSYTLSDAAVTRVESSSSHNISFHSYQMVGGKFTASTQLF
ncbi:MAG: hypothetical protein LBF21_02375 [Puniceicoccales bacterium]|jgi:hypothetical protein|nr:hypothetical protein [Puniceicoccales bacterium]